MAETRTSGRRRSTGSSPNGSIEEREDTRRVILRRERVIVLPDDVELAALASGDGAGKLAQALGLKSGKVPTGNIGTEAWVVVDEQAGSKQQAIRAHAGKPGTADARPGVYKAPTVTAWRGGEELVRPEQPKVEARPID